ncbi:MAG: chromosome segregation DNA-binding protein, chromosome partitioning protein, ParB family [Parcubacteria group bacterium GW2011_GWC1_43_12]|nr:MAG: chromosome segregation DNA-binding protein, chromosome partitioning protein, ParB family [Parcubacteria group bacterium GW2011_GWC1_43_12]
MAKLGKGLQSLIPPKQKATEVEYPRISNPLRDRKESIYNVEVSKVKPNPHQPRMEMDPISLKDLAESIKQHGILQPLIATKIVKESPHGQDVEYQLIAGHRRYEASKMIGLSHVPVIIRDITEQQKLELALVENLQRSDLNAIERAKAFKELQEEFNLTHEEIAEKVGKSREAVTNTLRLLNLPKAIQSAVESGRISEGHGRAILGTKNIAAQMALMDEVVEKNLSVRQAEERTREVYVHDHNRRLVYDPELKRLSRKIELYFGRKAHIKKSGLGGKVWIDYRDKDDLMELIKKLTGEG